MVINPEVIEISEGEIRTVSHLLADKLDPPDLLTSPPVVTEIGTTDLTLANKIINATTITVRNRTALTGQAVQFRVSGQKAGVTYSLKVLCPTVGGDTVGEIIRLECV